MATADRGKQDRPRVAGIVDEIITMKWVDFGDRKPVRAFVCTSPNPWGFPAKDRSGRLEQIEPPNLGELIAKLTSKATPVTNGPDKAVQHIGGKPMPFDYTDAPSP